MLELGRKDMEHNFRKFDRENPYVYETLRRLAYQAKKAGRKKIGMKMLYERARWEFYINSTEREYKLNNNYTAFYARKLMDENPELEGMFETRRQKGEPIVQNEEKVPAGA